MTTAGISSEATGNFAHRIILTGISSNSHPLEILGVCTGEKLFGWNVLI